MEKFKKWMALETKFNAARINALKDGLKDYAKDVNKEKRQLSRSCRYCWYLSGSMGTASFTPYTCMACKEEKMYHSGAVPALCNPCADEHSACARCGAEMD